MKFVVLSTENEAYKKNILIKYTYLIVINSN